MWQRGDRWVLAHDGAGGFERVCEVGRGGDEGIGEGGIKECRCRIGGV